MKRIIALILALAFLTGCGAKTGAAKEPAPSPAAGGQSGDLMEGIEPDEVTGHVPLEGEGAAAVTGFGLGLLQQCMGEKNALVSPLSVMMALAMTANGAAGDTLAQMEMAFGQDMEMLNMYLYEYVQSLPTGEGGSVHMANGIWFNADAGLSVEQDFLQSNANYYGAGVYEKPFDEALTAQINGWVSDNTAGRIEKIMENLSPGAVMCLVNALAFDGIWTEVYREDQVRPGTFTTAGGEEQDAAFMYSEEYGFLQDEGAEGFIKYYQGQNYAFAALLPDAGVDLADYIASLTGEKLQDILSQADGSAAVNAAIPKFTAEYGAELRPVLAAMGMADAFDSESADFSRISPEAQGLHIGQVMHKTYISVDEQGTQAGAATAVEIRETAMMGPEQTVYLDRPFVYMLVDCQANVPLFLGVVTDLG